MNATLALCAAVLSAAPAVQSPLSDTSSVYSAADSEQFELVIRGQAPVDGYPQPTFTQPGVPDAGAYGVPGAVVSPGVPAYGGVPYGGSPYGVTAPVGPDPFLGADPGYMPGGPFQEGRWGWYVGYDNVFVRPYFQRNTASAALGAVTFTASNVDWDLEYSPRMWFGVVAPDGGGYQARYWQFDHSTGSSSLSSGKQDLEMHVLDLEKVWHMNLQRGALSVSGGVRLASIEQDLRTVFAPPPPAFMDTESSFHGFGPTVSISGRRRVGYTNWAVFAGTRLALLFGDQSASQYLINPGLVPAAVNFEDGDDLIAVTELQLGIDWSAPVWYSTRFFLRAALEGQMWFGAGVTPTNNAIVGLPNTGIGDGNLGFLGFTVGTGLTY